MKRGLRTNELEQLSHFTDGETEWRQFKTTKRHGIEPGLGPGSPGPQARCGMTFRLRGSSWGSLQPLPCEEEGWQLRYDTTGQPGRKRQGLSPQEPGPSLPSSAPLSGQTAVEALEAGFLHPRSGSL